MAYPNPTKGNLTIILPDDISINELQITDYTSKMIYDQKVSDNQTAITISTDKWNPGIYIIRASGNNNTLAKKVVKY